MQTFDEELTKRTLVKMIGLINEAENERKRIKKIWPEACLMMCIAIMCFDRYFISALFDGMSRRVF